MRHSNLVVIREAANGQEAIDVCRRLRPELVLMDLRLPHKDGFEASRAIKDSVLRFGATHTWFYRDNEVGSLPDKVGSLPYDDKG